MSGGECGMGLTRALRRSKVLATIVVAIPLAWAAAGCSPAASSRLSTPSAPAPTTTPDSRPASAQPAARLPLSELRIRLTAVAGGLKNPIFATHAGDGSGRLFVVEQPGRVRVVRDGRTLSAPYLDISEMIRDGGERGLLGLAFSPDYESTGVLYVDFTDRDGNTVVARFTADVPASDAPSFQGPEVLLNVDQPYANHNGGCIAFAPDGTLWVGMGDGGGAGDPERRAQNPKELLGKILALDVSGESARAPRIVARGLRNPWRFSFDASTESVWIGDVGQNRLEELDRVPFTKMQDANFGWNLYEASRAFEPQGRGRSGLTFPVIEYGRRVGQSVTGGYVYRGKTQPAMLGTYFFGDFSAGWIAGARADGDGKWAYRILERDAGVLPSSFGVDEAGEIYVCDYGGRVLRIIAR